MNAELTDRKVRSSDLFGNFTQKIMNTHTLEQISKIDAILGEIRAELERATELFPTWPTDPIHAAAIVAEEAGELVREVNTYTYDPFKSNDAKVKDEAIQTGAMAVRFLLSLDQYRYLEQPQHTQTK